MPSSHDLDNAPYTQIHHQNIKDDIEGEFEGEIMSSAEALKEILEKLRKKQKEGVFSQREKGESFEKIVQIFFANEPKYQEIYQEILPYKEWALKYKPNETAKDTGIDLVAVKKDGGAFAAIQAKFYARDHYISKPDLDSFISASTLSHFEERYLVATTGHFGDGSKQILESLEDDGKPVIVVPLEDLENSSLDWRAYLKQNEIKRQNKKEPRQEQIEAIEKSYEHLKEGTLAEPAKGTLLMACGTGKTFTSLKIAEKILTHKGNQKKGGMVLFFAPSLHLISQTLTEWTQQTQKKMSAFAVCSDSKIGKKSNEDDAIGMHASHELAYPATTNAKNLAAEIKKIRALDDGDARMIVVFSTYHSSEVIGEAQHQEGLGAFDLVICDEAHRTSGSEIKGKEDENEAKAFQYIHKTEAEKGIKRKRVLFMTATPRIFASDALEKAKTADIDVTLYSMDDEKLYGAVIYQITFAQAVKMGRLCPYKIVVLGISEQDVAAAIPNYLRDNSNDVTLDMASRMIGAWKGLSKEDLRGEKDFTPMRRAVAFCSTIAPSKKKVSNIASKVVERSFGEVVEEYRKEMRESGALYYEGDHIECQVRHVDGTMNAAEKNERLNWLKEEPLREEPHEKSENICRILSNVRCLSEGVDVPALDAVIFLAPNNSEVDVVQSVGRVMRTAAGKKRGYIIIPVVVPEGKTADEYFSNVSKSGKNHPFKTVWTVLQALRAHDTSLDEEFDRINLGGRADFERMEVVCVSSSLDRLKKSKSQRARENLNARDASHPDYGSQEPLTEEELKNANEQLILAFSIQKKLANDLYARFVQKVGQRNPFGRWSQDVKRIVNRHIIAIERLLSNDIEKLASAEEKQKYEHVKAIFERLKKEIHTTINPNLPENEIIQMLGQHLVTGPVFDALFGADKASTPMTAALNDFTEELYKAGLAKEQKGLEAFYESVKARLKDATPEMRHNFTIKLYNDFFKEAFKEQTEKLGIVYTPLPIVDFIIRSVDDILKQEFGVGMGSEKVSILDPFTGTGSFIARLIELQNTEKSDYILPDADLEAKYKAAKTEEAILGRPGLWANEIVLLAYYVASVNIAASYAKRTGKRESFGGLCLTDTFNLTKHIDERQKSFDTQNTYLKINSERILAQESAPIKVIIGNPPYSAGAKTAGGAQNDRYESLDKRIEETYVQDSNAANKNGLYNSYIKALRWASDRVDDEGVIGFVTGGGFLEGNTSAGIRKHLEQDFSQLYIFHLRGDIRKGIREKSREVAQKEGNNIFGQGNQSSVAISILVKKKNLEKNKENQKSKIFFCDIGDYLTASEKYAYGEEEILECAPETDKFYWLNHFKSIVNIPEAAEDAGEDTNPEGLFRCWQKITPDDHYDWINQRDESFSQFMLMGNKKNSEKAIFENYSNGLGTSRDEWVWNFSEKVLENSVIMQVETYEKERARLNRLLPNSKTKEDKEKRLAELKKSPDYAGEKISWSSSLVADILANEELTSEEGEIREGMYRPFIKHKIFFSNRLNHRVSQLPKIFPIKEAIKEGKENKNFKNQVICVTGDSANLSALMVDSIPDLELIHHAQCFPLYLYEEITEKEESEENMLFSNDLLKIQKEPQNSLEEYATTPSGKKYRCKSAITSEGLEYFKEFYKSQKNGLLSQEMQSLEGEDVFYYIYALFHMEHYRTKYATSLSKELPRIPCVKREEDFWAMRKIGYDLAQLHLHYEDEVEFYHIEDIANLDLNPIPNEKLYYKVEKMRFAKKRHEETGKMEDDKTRIIFNDYITIKNIPLSVYAYKVNGKSAIEWVIERLQITKGKRTNIENDPNDWAREEAYDPAWCLKLLLKIIRVSDQTNRLIKELDVIKF